VRMCVFRWKFFIVFSGGAALWIADWVSPLFTRSVGSSSKSSMSSSCINPISEPLYCTGSCEAAGAAKCTLSYIMLLFVAYLLFDGWLSVLARSGAFCVAILSRICRLCRFPTLYSEPTPSVVPNSHSKPIHSAFFDFIRRQAVANRN